MKKSYLLRRPHDDDDDYYSTEIIKAKPLNEKHAKILGFGGKDFVKASEKSQEKFYGTQTVLNNNKDILQPLSHDERNKINAKIIKAELKGNNELVKKLKAKLDRNISEKNLLSEDIKNNKEILLMKIDNRSGLMKPARSDSTSKQNLKKGTVENIYNQDLSINEMVAKEKSTSAEDQLTMFGRAAKMCSGNKVDDDWVVDDNIVSHPKKRRHEEKNAQQSIVKKIKDHKIAENTLDSCKLCIDSRNLAKHSIVATGLKTYLAVVPWDGLSSDHCFIAPMSHYASSVQLDEDVFDELKLWYKGLCAMWQGVNENDLFDEEDCVFFENAKNVKDFKHMTIECVPLPKEMGDVAPIFFRKAIVDSEKEWSDNEKLIDLSKPKYNGSIKKAIPKGFPYFSINFGLQPGYAHVIENDNLFSSNFAQEIIAGMLDLPHNKWRNVRQMSLDEVKQKRDCFRQKWKNYDWTEKVKKAISKRDN